VSDLVTNHPGDLLTTGDVAKVAGVTPPTVVRWADEGKLPVSRTASGVRLFMRADVEAYLARRGTAVSGEGVG
jgi:excisionase family DNA binding protein